MENRRIGLALASMIATYYIELFDTQAYRHNCILMSLLLLVAEAKSNSNDKLQEIFKKKKWERFPVLFGNFLIHITVPLKLGSNVAEGVLLN